MASLLNGLSQLGAGVAEFSGRAGLETQRADLARQNLALADQLATNRELNVTQPFAKSQLETSEAGATARSSATNATSLATNTASNAGALARTQLEVGKPTGELQMARALAGPNPTQEQLNDALTTVLNGRSKFTFSSATQVDPADPNKTVSGVNVMNTRTGETEFRATGTNPNRSGAGGALSSDTTDQLADRVLAGDNSALTGLGYGNQGAANRASVQEKVTQRLRDKGLTGADLVAKTTGLMGERAGARTAGTREANVGMAVTEAQLFIPLALDASKAVSRTNFPTLNSIMQAAEKGVGGEDIVRLAVATNSLVNAYSRAITPSGIPTEGNQTRARELLDKAWSQGQYAAAVDQLSKEMNAAKQSPIQQQAEQSARISGRTAATTPEAAGPAYKPPDTGASPSGAAPRAAASPVGAIPSWAQPGDQYNAQLGLARRADGTTYGAPK